MTSLRRHRNDAQWGESSPSIFLVGDSCELLLFYSNWMDPNGSLKHVASPTFHLWNDDQPWPLSREIGLTVYLHPDILFQWRNHSKSTRSMDSNWWFLHFLVTNPKSSSFPKHPWFHRDTGVSLQFQLKRNAKRNERFTRPVFTRQVCQISHELMLLCLQQVPEVGEKSVLGSVEFHDISWLYTTENMGNTGGGPFQPGGLQPWNFMTFQSVGNFIIPTDELHHFSEG